MTTDTPIRAWRNNPDLKAEVVARMRAHRAADEIVRGVYQLPDSDTASGYRGCALGCTLPLLDDETRNQYDLYPSGPLWWARIETEYGIPAPVAELIDDTFESQDEFEEAAAFAVDVIEAIPVGADLDRIADDFHVAQMRDAEDYGARWLIEHLAAAPVPEAAR